MPNPLTQFQLNMSRRKNAVNEGDEKKGIPPVPEEYEGENNPYRGIEQHGVAPTENANPFKGFEGDQVGLATIPLEREIDPIPVINVTQGGRELKTWRSHNFSINNTKGSQRLVGRNLSRSSIYVQNLDSANSVWLSQSPISSENAADSFELGATADVTLPTQDPIYVFTTSANMVKVQALEFYAVELPERDK